ncbi:MAG: DUF6285 domain-containing protein [Spirochaetia bacterium]|nr:DUF6285 domain-containing protein [Spirochaetia bacterium]
MQDRPDAPVLLEAIADFLMKEILPAVKESDALAYKTLVSWNMLGVVSREFREGDRLAEKEIARLLGYFKESGTGPDTYPEKLAFIRELNARLAKQIRDGNVSNENKVIWDLAREALKEKLSVANPRFGTD